MLIKFQISKGKKQYPKYKRQWKSRVKEEGGKDYSPIHLNRKMLCFPTCIIGRIELKLGN